MAAWAFACAGGLQAGVDQKQVQHAPLAGVHLGKVIRVAAFLDVVDGVFGVLAEVLGALGFEAVYVEGDAVVFAGFEVEDLGGDTCSSATRSSPSRSVRRSASGPLHST